MQRVGCQAYYPLSYNINAQCLEPSHILEYTELKKYLKPYEAYKLESSKTNLQAIGDGGIAIIDQWICAHARYVLVRVMRIWIV